MLALLTPVFFIYYDLGKKFSLKLLNVNIRTFSLENTTNIYVFENILY